MDDIDKKILLVIQDDATLAISEIAEQVGLSTTPCWRRIQKMESSGVIKNRVALLDPKKMNVGVTVFIAIRTNVHSQEWLDRFQSAVADIPEIMEFHRMSGEIDYLMRAVVPSIEVYDNVYKRLIERLDFTDVTSMFAMETIKSTTVIPVTYV